MPISRLEASDIQRYYQDSYVFINGALHLVSVNSTGVVIFDILSKKRRTITYNEFCDSVEVVWPVAGYKYIEDGIFYVSWQRDEYKKAPTKRGMHLSEIKSVTKNTGEDYMKSIFFPVYTEEVPCSFCCIVNERAYINGMRAVKAVKKGDRYKISTNNFFMKKMIEVINKEAGKDVLEVA